jgi:hypothetical protein
MKQGEERIQKNNAEEEGEQTSGIFVSMAALICCPTVFRLLMEIGEEMPLRCALTAVLKALGFVELTNTYFSRGTLRTQRESKGREGVDRGEGERRK